jgi:hypothetical protein
MTPASRLLQPLPAAVERRALLCATVGRRSSRDERLPLRESAPLVAGMSLALWGAIGALVWSILG